MSPEDQQVRIDNYLLGLGTPEERREFEEELSRDPGLGEQLAGTRLAMDAIELFEDDRLKSHLQTLEAGLAGTQPPAEATPSAPVPGPEAKVIPLAPLKRSRRTLLAYAASLLLLLLAGWWLFQQSSTTTPAQLAVASFEPYDNITPGPVRSSGDDTTEAAAYRNYDLGNYDQAIQLFSALPPTHPRSFYLGQSLLAQKRYAEAESVFTPLSQLSVDEFSLMGESTYALGISQLGLNEVEAARATLRKAATVPGNRLAGEARALLEKLD